MKVKQRRLSGWQRLSLVVVPLLTALFSLVLATTAWASATTVTTNTTFPISLSGVFVPCAAGGAGELVDLSGNFHDLFHTTSDGSGGFHVEAQDNPQGVSGVGETTENKYQETGAIHFSFNVTAGGTIVETYVSSYRLIGQGPGNNFLVHNNLHVTVNPDGTVTSFHDSFSISCQ